MSKFNYFNTINLIRHIAALLVIYAHSFELIETNQVDSLKYLLNVDMGFLAVNVFFFLSGSLIYQSAVNSTNLLNYFSKRGIRILPALWVCLIITTLLFWIDSDLYLTDYLTDSITINYLLNAFLMGEYIVLDIFDNNFYSFVGNGSLWTLRYEVVMYIIASIFVFKVVRKRNYIVYALFLVFFILMCVTISDDTNAFKNLGRLGTFFFAGAISSKISFRSWDKRFLILMPALIGMTHIISFVGKEYLVSLCFIILIKWLIDLVNNLDNNSKVIKFDISYGLYIYAFPVQQFLSKYLFFSDVYFYFLCSTLITSILATCSWTVVESKALKFKNVIK
ncbi:acyltransferase family protein [Vibrio harveyi]|uniref:acyltransferase family protein n=1 Tax=Vibrio harveyi TaxID=669 RepID=UPI00165D4F6D|nr:acyltransferase [Vibrio harveyi]